MYHLCILIYVYIHMFYTSVYPHMCASFQEEAVAGAPSLSAGFGVPPPPPIGGFGDGGLRSRDVYASLVLRFQGFEGSRVLDFVGRLCEAMTVAHGVCNGFESLGYTPKGQDCEG